MHQTTGLNRSSLDKYYTKPSVVEQLMDIFKNQTKVNRKDVVIEPAAGSGVFIPSIKSLSKNTYFFDIMPEHNDITKQDFLSLDTGRFLQKNSRIHVVGNPPFGRQSTLAKRFISKSTEFADTIAFVLPRSFKKTSMQAAFPRNWHLRFQTDLKPNSFTVNDEDLDVPSVFQIWYRDDTKKRRIPKKLKPVGFQFVKKNESPDFAVRRIGFYAGKVYSDQRSKNEESHFFVKVNKKRDLNTIKNSFGELSFAHKNTVGPRSVSKQELLHKLPKDLRIKM